MAGHSTSGPSRLSYSMPSVNVQAAVEIEKQSKFFRYSVTTWIKKKSAMLDQRQSSKRQSDPDLLKFISYMERALTPTVQPYENIPPAVHKVKILLWSDLTLDNIDHLNECQDYEQIRHMLADIFRLGNYKQNLKASIILDFYYYNLQFARKENFSPEKTSAFFSIMKAILEVCQETSYGNLDITYNYFKELLFCHCVNRPPKSVELFTNEEVVTICSYALNTFFRHFKLYKYVFTPTIRLDLTLKYIGTSPVSPFEGDTKESIQDEVEDQNSSEESAQTAVDSEKLRAQEELKRIVTELLMSEARKIEGNIDQHLKTAVESLNAKLEPLVDTAPAKTVKGKKR